VRSQAGFASLADGLVVTPLLDDAPALTPRERELVGLVGCGWSNAEIARELTLSVRTVETHLSAAYRKLGVTRQQLLRTTWLDPHLSA
jgi:DNA-binding NarL/FixJ family response regulator